MRRLSGAAWETVVTQYSESDECNLKRRSSCKGTFRKTADSFSLVSFPEVVCFVAGGLWGQ